MRVRLDFDLGSKWKFGQRPAFPGSWKIKALLLSSSRNVAASFEYLGYGRRKQRAFTIHSQAANQEGPTLEANVGQLNEDLAIITLRFVSWCSRAAFGL